MQIVMTISLSEKIKLNRILFCIRFRSLRIFWDQKLNLATTFFEGADGGRGVREFPKIVIKNLLFIKSIMYLKLFPQSLNTNFADALAKYLDDNMLEIILGLLTDNKYFLCDSNKLANSRLRRDFPPPPGE